MQDGQFHARRRERGSAGGSAVHELEDLFDALSLGSANEGHRRSEFSGELGRIHVAAAAFEIVGHVEDHQRRQLQAENRRGQHQMAAQIGAIQDQQQGVGLGNAGHVTRQDIARDLLVFRARIQAVDAGQIHQDNVVVVRSAIHFGFAYAMFDGDAREVGDFLAQAGEAIEERRFARVGRADDGDDVRTRALVQLESALRQQRIRHSRGNRSWCNLRCAHSSDASPLDGRRIKCDAVSRRSATSEPSTR